MCYLACYFFLFKSRKSPFEGGVASATGDNSDFLTSEGNWGIFAEFLVTLYVFLPGTKADDVIPVFSGNRILDGIVNNGWKPHTAYP